jgi:hypothetical protein
MANFEEGEVATAYLPPYNDYPNCPDCRTGFYNLEEQSQSGLYIYSSGISGASASRIISRHLTTIRESTDVLTKAIGTHADVFINRWTKRSQAKRQKLLQKVAPHIAQSPWHCFNYNDIPAEARLEYVRNPRTRKQLLLPWLDLETLKRHPDILFALLHFRIHYPPQDWAEFDIKQLDMGWKAGYFEVRFARQGVIVHGPRYGQLVEWDGSASHRGDILGFPRAELLFEAQAYLMTTLRDLVVQVLDGVDPAAPARTSKGTQLASTYNFKKTDEIEHWSPYIYPAFSPPPAFDLGHLISLATVRLEAIGDHLWQLQCNTAYMRGQLNLFPGTKAISEEKKTLRSFLFLVHIMEEIFSYMGWRWVVIECKKAEELQRRFRDSIHPGQPLPHKYETAIRELELILVNMINRVTGNLFRDIAAGDGFSQYFTIRTSPDELPVVDYDVQLREQWDAQDPLLWCLLQMRIPSDLMPHPFDNALLHSYLQHHLSVSNFQEKARVSEFAYRWAADLLTLSEMLDAVRLNGLRAKPINPRDVTKTDHAHQWAIMGDRGKGLNMRAIHTLAQNLTEEAFRHTGADPRTKNGPGDLVRHVRRRKTSGRLCTRL